MLTDEELKFNIELNVDRLVKRKISEIVTDLHVKGKSTSKGIFFESNDYARFLRRAGCSQ